MGDVVGIAVCLVRQLLWGVTKHDIPIHLVNDFGLLKERPRQVARRVAQHTSSHFGPYLFIFTQQISSVSIIHAIHDPSCIQVRLTPILEYPEPYIFISCIASSFLHAIGTFNKSQFLDRLTTLEDHNLSDRHRFGLVPEG